MPDRTCAVDGCARAAKHGGLCHGHRRRIRVHGDPMPDLPIDVRVKSGGPCMRDGCTSTAKTRGLCPAHYQQERKLARGVVKKSRPLNCMWVAMQLYVRPRDQGCWTDWAGATHQGRPLVTMLRTRKNTLVARYVRYLEDGSWPVYACHHCDNPACWNPDHVYAGDPRSNVADMVSRGRHRYILPRTNNMHLGRVNQD